MKVKVFLLKDVEKVGCAKEILLVSRGLALNYLIPRNLVIQVTAANEAELKKRSKNIEERKTVIASQTSMLAEKIKSTTITLKKKIHDDGKLYGAVNPADIMDLMADKGIRIAKSQVDFGKSIKHTGTYDVTIKLSSRLQPQVKLKVVGEQK